MFPPIHRFAAASWRLPAAVRRNKPYLLSGLNVGGAVEIAFVTDIVGGTIGPLIDGAIGSTQRRQDDQRQRRRAAAAALPSTTAPDGQAADYVALCLSRIREWENEWSARSAQRIAIQDFDDGLRITERHPTC